MSPSPLPTRPSARRSIAKAVTYRLVVMVADATAIYLFTGQWRIALGFMVASNVYTTVLYFLHERAWAHVRWGRGEWVGPGLGSAGVALASPVIGPHEHEQRG